MFHSCGERSSTGFTSPYSPVFMLLLPALLTAVVVNTRLPHTIGLEVATPGIGVFHLMFLPVATSQSVTARWPSPLPALPSPRNDDQLRGPVARGIVPGGSIAGGGVVSAAAAAAGGAASAVTRASVSVTGPWTSPIDSTRPPRSLKVSVALTSTTRKTFSAVGTRRTWGCPCT